MKQMERETQTLTPGQTVKTLDGHVGYFVLNKSQQLKYSLDAGATTFTDPAFINNETYHSDAPVDLWVKNTDPSVNAPIYVLRWY